MTVSLRRAILVAVLAGCAAPATSGRGEARPNVIIILVDDLGWADLGYSGSDLHETPNIDRFARENLRFTDAYASASICTPTRAALLTGKAPARLHMTIWRESARRPHRGRPLTPPMTVEDLPHSETTLAEVLKEAGYRTAHVGKWHLGGASHFPETHGFDLNIGGTHWGAPNTFYYPFTGDDTFRDWRYVPGLEPGKPGDYLTDRLTDRALEVIDAFQGEPFFLHLAYHTVHTPIEGKPEVARRYAAKIHPGLHHANAHLAAMVHSLDENVGRILDRVESLGILDRTIVIFTSDNGGYINSFKGKRVTCNAPLRSGKGSLYEGGIRVPLVIRWPGVTRAGVSSEPVQTTDLYPTLLEAIGLKGDEKHNATVDGVSLVPILRDPHAKLAARSLFWHYPHYYRTTDPVSAIRRGRWKLLEYHGTMKTELYDLSADLGETKDLAEEKPDLAANLVGRLHAWRKAVDAQMPVPNPDHRPR